MSIRAPDSIYMTLALRAFEVGDYERALEFFDKCPSTKRRAHKEKLIQAHYTVGLSLSAENKFLRSSDHFRNTMSLTDDTSLKHICQNRLRLINAITTRNKGIVPDWVSRYGEYCDDCPKNRSLHDCASCDRRGMPVNPAASIGLYDLTPEVKEIHCAGAYRHAYDPHRSNPFSKGIRMMKKRGGQQLAEVFGHMLAEFLKDRTGLRSRVDFIIPVPTTTERYEERWFKIPDILADIVSTRLAIPWFQVLDLTRDTSDLRGFSKSDRRRELNEAFTVSNAPLVRRRNVLVIDDVVTYGTTLREIGATLRKAGADDVFAAVLAHTESSFFK